MATTTSASGSRSKLWILMITAFIDMVGLLMVIPLLPFYAKTLGAGGLVVGILVSSFSVAQLISAPMWGRFSRRPDEGNANVSYRRRVCQAAGACPVSPGNSADLW